MSQMMRKGVMTGCESMKQIYVEVKARKKITSY